MTCETTKIKFIEKSTAAEEPRKANTGIHTKEGLDIPVDLTTYAQLHTLPLVVVCILHTLPLVVDCILHTLPLFVVCMENKNEIK